MLKPANKPRGARDATANLLEATVALMAFAALFFAGVAVALLADARMLVDMALVKPSGGNLYSCLKKRLKSLW